MNRSERINVFADNWGEQRPWLKDTPKVGDRKDETNISMAVYCAYRDAARPSIKKTQELDKALTKLTEAIEEYLLRKDKNFDHKKWSEILKKDGSLTYGQAQKIINMAFK